MGIRGISNIKLVRRNGGALPNTSHEESDTIKNFGVSTSFSFTDEGEVKRFLRKLQKKQGDRFPEELPAPEYFLLNRPGKKLPEPKTVPVDWNQIADDIYELEQYRRENNPSHLIQPILENTMLLLDLGYSYMEINPDEHEMNLTLFSIGEETTLGRVTFIYGENERCDEILTSIMSKKTTKNDENIMEIAMRSMVDPDLGVPALAKLAELSKQNLG